MFRFKKASNEGPWPGKFLGTFPSKNCTASGSVSAKRKPSTVPSDGSKEVSLRTFAATTEEAVNEWYTIESESCIGKQECRGNGMH